MTATAPTYKDMLRDIADISELAREDVREMRDELDDLSSTERIKQLRRYFRQAVYRHAVKTCWFESPVLMEQALRYVDRYAIDDDVARCFIRRGCAEDPNEQRRALLIACIFHHVTRKPAR